jgi:hypothetical protein
MPALRARPGRSAALMLSAALCAGCGTPDTLMDHWTYSGHDESLRSPPRIPRGELSVAAWMLAMHQAETLWWDERTRVIARAKETCARETGLGTAHGYWLGYPRAFKACMQASGWTEGRSPL